MISYPDSISLTGIEVSVSSSYALDIYLLAKYTKGDSPTKR
ncbi:MAG: hypothetical protein AB2598_10615 [Candidatus Thiodiazotropha sp.]